MTMLLSSLTGLTLSIYPVLYILLLHCL